jgi:hypothetical protein
MIDLPSLIIFIIISALWFGTTILLVSTLIRKKRLTLQLIQQKVDSFVLAEHLQKLIDEQGVKSIEETEGFLKFLSESRDAAFKYIEDVQEAIENYRQIADVIPLSKDMSLQQAERLSSTYDRLIGFLPEENLL